MTDVTASMRGMRAARHWIGFRPVGSGAGPAARIGPLLLTLVVVLSAVLAFGDYAGHGAGGGMAVGAASFVAMSLALVLAARPRLLEPLFGGLDRMYRAHRALGIAALVLMILHQSYEPDFDNLVRETNLGETAEKTGELAFNLLLALIGVSLLRRLPVIGIEIPYQIWRFSHRLMGLLFAGIAFHQFAIDIPAGRTPTTALMLNGFAIAGIAAWIYTEFLAPMLRRRPYEVAAIHRRGKQTELTLTPKGRALRWRPGQFVFLRADKAGMSEPHPFTIAAAPRKDGCLRLMIAARGGWTRRLPQALAVGMPVALEGPYGRFDYRKGGRQQLWLAGGIGVTPFLAWAEGLTAAETRRIHLVYSLRNPDEAMGLEILQAAAARNPRFSFEVIATSRDGRLTPARLVQTAPFAPREADLWFCGPQGLKDSMVEGLAALGQKPRRLRFEHFEFA